MQRKDASKATKKNLVGLISPHVLSAAEADPISPVVMDLQACDMLEIRYDWFEKSLWPGLSARVRKIAPDAEQIGTIRLARDGGTFPDDSAVERPALWQSIFAAQEVPEWMDLERDCLHDYDALAELATPHGTRIIVSEHNFVRIPTLLELKKFAQDVQRVKAAGLKIAAMSNGPLDCQRLYQFISKNAKNFEMFAAFGMGKTGKPSRIWSLHEGANLTYGSIEINAAPGQIDVMTMKKAIDALGNFSSENDIAAFLNKFE
ncbi:MAG: type I 3-dehydroquinate dehydratase [Fibrobacter sp.]|nr:type I 3-dehydroquinate dehydratase [Fibrobacter sp.]